MYVLVAIAQRETLVFSQMRAAESVVREQSIAVRKIRWTVD